jgi:diaminopimelate decarboxylase
MPDKTLPFNDKQLREIASRFPTPFHIYDEKAIRENARDFINAFDWAPSGFRNYYAVKACPNPYIMKILKEEGMGADCSSLPELLLAEKIGLSNDMIMFTSNDTPLSEFTKAKGLNAIINLDDITHISALEKIGVPDTVCFRYNPGPLKEGNSIIGKPEEAKYGFTRDQLFEGFSYLRDQGVKKFGLHTMVASNELNPSYFMETAEILFQVLTDLSEKLNIHFDFVNLGGGIGIPYRPEQKKVDLHLLSEGLKKIYSSYIVMSGHKPPRIFMECGRMVTGPYGYLVTTAIHKKNTYRNYIGVDACMADLMRPGMYGAYHHITIPGKEKNPVEMVYDVVGSLCENNDKFAVARNLPKVSTGDLMVIHDTGAHGYAMGFNYNGKLRHAELLLKENGEVVQIRRAETVDDYFATLDFSKL